MPLVSGGPSPGLSIHERVAHAPRRGTCANRETCHLPVRVDARLCILEHFAVIVDLARGVLQYSGKPERLEDDMHLGPYNGHADLAGVDRGNGGPPTEESERVKRSGPGVRWGDPCLTLLKHPARGRDGAPARVVARWRSSLVFLDPREVWAFEAADRLTFVHSCQGRFDVDLSLTALASVFRGELVRVHRNWLVNIDFVRTMERVAGETALCVGTALVSERIRVPVSRQYVKTVRALLLEGATGIRHE